MKLSEAKLKEGTEIRLDRILAINGKPMGLAESAELYPRQG